MSKTDGWEDYALEKVALAHDKIAGREGEAKQIAQSELAALFPGDLPEDCGADLDVARDPTSKPHDVVRAVERLWGAARAVQAKIDHEVAKRAKDRR